ncbi:MAG: ATP-binding protein [Candidatus Micrarchaeia archaeon]
MVLENAEIASNCIFLSEESEPRIGEKGIYIGKTAIYKVPFMLDIGSNINPHIAIVGMTGSGKTYLAKSISARAASFDGYKLVIFDWTGEYADLMEFLGGEIVSLGTKNHINIFDLAGRKDRQEIAYMLAQELKLEKEELSVIESFLNSKKKQSLHSMISALKSNTTLAAKLSLLDDNPALSARTDFNIKCLLKCNTSIDLSHIKSNAQKALISRLLLKAIIKAMRKMGISSKVRALIVIDEAWQMLSNSDELLTLFREGRKYGVGIIISTQLLDDINNAVIANAGCIISFRLQSPKDFKILSSIGLGDMVPKLASLQMGSCMVRLNRKYGGSRNFVISHVDGFEIEYFCICGGRMQIYVPSNKFFKSLESLGENAKTALSNLAIENNRRLDLVALIKELVKCGLDRSQIVSFLAKLGVDSLSIAIAYERSVPGDELVR